jgi:hypothetical protein
MGEWGIMKVDIHKKAMAVPDDARLERLIDAGEVVPTRSLRSRRKETAARTISRAALPRWLSGCCRATSG